MGIRRVTGSSPCLILVMRIERSLPQSVSGASKFISVQDRMSMKLQSKLGDCMSVKTKLIKKLQSVRGVDEEKRVARTGKESMIWERLQLLHRSQTTHLPSQRPKCPQVLLGCGTCIHSSCTQS
eukprot:1143639-Pelagomonas_calceolata.AAC.1